MGVYWIVLVKSLIESFGYPIIFSMIVFESLPLIGVIIPGGTPAVVAAGIFSRFGVFKLGVAYLVCITATLFIDNVGYFTGKIAKKEKFHKIVGCLFIKKKFLEKIGHLVRCHTGKAVILGRLNPPTRSVIPFVIGNEKVSYTRFLFFSVISAFIWVSTFFIVGYLFAESLHMIDSINRAILWGTIFLIIIAYVYYVVKSYVKKNGKGGFFENGSDCEKQGKRVS